MPSLSYKAVGFTEFQNWLNKSKPIMAKIGKDTMSQIVDEGVQYMKSKAPVDTGFMRTNITGHVTGTANAVINSSAYYSGFVNFGTRYMEAQPFFSDGIDYINSRIQSILRDQFLAQMRNR